MTNSCGNPTRLQRVTEGLEPLKQPHSHAAFVTLLSMMTGHGLMLATEPVVTLSSTTQRTSVPLNW